MYAILYTRVKLDGVLTAARAETARVREQEMCCKEVWKVNDPGSSVNFQIFFPYSSPDYQILTFCTKKLGKFYPLFLVIF